MLKIIYAFLCKYLKRDLEINGPPGGDLSSPWGPRLLGGSGVLRFLVDDGNLLVLGLLC